MLNNKQKLVELHKRMMTATSCCDQLSNVLKDIKTFEDAHSSVETDVKRMEDIKLEVDGTVLSFQDVADKIFFPLVENIEEILNEQRVD